MENSKITVNENTCSISNLRMFEGENNEIVCLKICKGDWGDWDDEPEVNIQNTSIDSHNNTTDVNFDKP